MGDFRPLRKTMDILRQDDNLIDIFAFNEFSEDVEFLKQPEWDYTIKKGDSLGDQDIIQLRYYISRVHNSEPSKYIVGDSCFLAAKCNSYHPVKRYIEAVKWDQVKRIDEWLIHSTGCEDNCYTRQAGAKFLIATVSRVYNPGCKFDHMLILEGRQSLGKSTLIEEIAGEWFLDTNFGHKDKDLIDSMRGAFIIEISELSGMTKKDVDWLKSFLSRKVDRIRLPYASRSKDFKRKCVFVGTYNPSGNNMYLRDDTGNRRFWPVECGDSINIKYVRDNRAQLWAEALVRFKAGEQYYIKDPEALKILSGIHSERELESPTFNIIKKWLVGQGGSVSMEYIIEGCLGICIKNKMPKELLSVSTTVGIIMRKIGWEKGTNNNRNIYYRPDIVVEEPAEEWDE